MDLKRLLNYLLNEYSLTTVGLLINLSDWFYFYLSRYLIFECRLFLFFIILVGSTRDNCYLNISLVSSEKKRVSEGVSEQAID